MTRVIQFQGTRLEPSKSQLAVMGVSSLPFTGITDSCNLKTLHLDSLIVKSLRNHQRLNGSG